MEDVLQVSGVIHSISNQEDTLFSNAKIRIQENFMSLEDMDLKIRKWNRFNVLNITEKLNNRLKVERDSLNAELKRATDSYRSMDAFKKFSIQEDMVSHPIDLLMAKQSPLIFVFVIVFQTCVMGVWMGLREPSQLRAVWHARKTALWVGVTGLLGSLGWFTAFTLQTAAYVKGLGQIELLFSLCVSILFFQERVSRREVFGILFLGLSVLGVIFAA